MISVELARRLRDTGLSWEPEDADRFFIPDRDLDGHIFSISQMSVDVRDVAGGQEIAFNGAVEWALDAIMRRDVVWLPSESQLREGLGDTFVGLAATPDGHRVDTRQGGIDRRFTAGTAADAYGLALLDLLERSPDVFPPLRLDD